MTAKPASAPPVDALEMSARLAKMLVRSGETTENRQALRYAVEALAASAQVREAEPSGDDEKWGQQYRCGCFLGFPTRKSIPGHCPQHLRDKQGPAMHFPPAPEPAPVAQGDGYFILRFFRDLTDEQRRFLLVGLGAMPDAPSEPFTHAIQRRILDRLLATIADHARIVAELQAQLHDQRWQHAQELKRATELEASLAACRADAERYRWLRAYDNADLLAEDVIDDAIDAIKEPGNG